jgi:hypothetical protein
MDGNMAPKTKRDIGLISIGAVCAAIISIIVLATYVNGYIDEKVRRIAKSQVEIQNKQYYEWIETIYEYNQNCARLDDRSKKIWNEAVMSVRSRTSKKAEIFK